jgi:streptomycin 6-kinase
VHIDLPPAFRQRVVGVAGQSGEAWVDALPTLVASFAGRWRLAILPPYQPPSYNYVAPAVRADGTGCVLKACLPGPERETEPAMLDLCDGRGMVRLLEHDPEAGVMLLERLEPGTPLLELQDDDEATRIAARVMRRFWRPVPQEHVFPSIADWLRGFDRHCEANNGGSGPLPRDLFERAESLAPQLLASSAEPVVLHGDLHHWNILAAQREPWLAIDPKGVTGEPAYDVGAWLRNPMPNIPETPVLERRVAIFADELGFDRQRLVAWGAVGAVLSAVWSAEGGGTNWGPATVAAERLFSLLR